MNKIPTHKSLLAAKLSAIAGFLMLVASTYYLRSEVLALSHIGFSADEVRAENELKRMRESFPERKKEYVAEMKYYRLQMDHYHKMLDLYENDYAQYIQRIKDKYDTPPQPTAPVKPDSPEVAEKLFEINTEFRIRKNHYFATATRLNWMACCAALLLVGGLVSLLMLDTSAQRWHYLVALVISFVFLIGPAFHSILTGIIGFLEEPGIY